MSHPKPTKKPPSSYRMVKNPKPKGKTYIYICEDPRNKQEVRAENPIEAGEICIKRHNFHPYKITRKPREPQERLTQKAFAGNDALRKLKNQLIKEQKTQ